MKADKHQSGAEALDLEMDSWQRQIAENNLQKQKVMGNLLATLDFLTGS